MKTNGSICQQSVIRYQASTPAYPCSLIPGARSLISVSRTRPELWRGALVLAGTRDLGIQNLRRVPTPVWIVQHGAGERHHVCLAFSDDLLRLPGRGNQADSTRGNTGVTFDLLGERDIHARHHIRPRVRADAARRDANEVDAGALERLGESG